MASVVINGDTSGAITISAPAVAGTNTLTLPALTGTALLASSLGSSGQVLTSNGASALPSFETLSKASGTISFVEIKSVNGTTNTDITNIGTFSTLFITAFTAALNTTGGNLRVAVSSNNGSSFGTANQISVAVSTTNSYTVYGNTYATISNANVSGNKTITPFSNNGGGTIFSTTATETSITGTLNALRFNHSATSAQSTILIMGVS